MVDETRLKVIKAYRFNRPLQREVDFLFDEAGKVLNQASKTLFESPVKHRKLMEQHERISAQEKMLASIMVDRNLIGQELEAANREDEAIELYEANVQDEFAGSHPYRRLAIIYRKRKQFDEEVRVLRQALTTAGHTMNPNKLEWFKNRQARALELQTKHEERL
jgi:tetratricopeptide (TPR) repeat protein